MLQLLLNGLFFYRCLVTESWDYLDVVLAMPEVLGVAFTAVGLLGLGNQKGMFSSPQREEFSLPA